MRASEPPAAPLLFRNVGAEPEPAILEVADTFVVDRPGWRGCTAPLDVCSYA